MASVKFAAAFPLSMADMGLQPNSRRVFSTGVKPMAPVLSAPVFNSLVAPDPIRTTA
jgi:hypothetical protein